MSRTLELNRMRREVHRAIETLTQQDLLKRAPSQRDIAHALNITQTRVRQHLLALRRLGLVDWIPGEDRSLHILRPLSEVEPEAGRNGEKHSVEKG